MRLCCCGYLFLFISCLFFSPWIRADTLKEVPLSLLHGFTYSGYLDGSYNYLLRSNHFISGMHDREFDLEPHGFTLQQAAITVAKQPEVGWGGLLNLILGRDANELSAYGMNPNYFGIQNIGLDLTQVYLQYSLNTFTLLGGKFNSLLGFENYNPVTDTNFSRSILDDYAEPGTLIGVQAIYTLNNKLVLSADVSNGWDTIKYTSRQKTLEARATYTANNRWFFYVTGITGIQPIVDGAGSGPTGRRSTFEFVGSLQANDKLSFIVDCDYGVQTKAALPNNTASRATWQGIAGYINYQLNDKWLTSFRSETFYDQNGYRTGVRQNWREVTLTLAFHLLKNLVFRAETRHDFSNVKSFTNSNGVNANNNQQSFAMEGLYTF